MEKDLMAWSVASPSWPGVSRPSTSRRRSADGRDTPYGHQDKGTDEEGPFPSRHGPARPGHRHPHVPRQMARTSRAMTGEERLGPPNLSPGFAFPDAYCVKPA